MLPFRYQNSTFKLLKCPKTILMHVKLISSEKAFPGGVYNRIQASADKFFTCHVRCLLLGVLHWPFISTKYLWLKITEMCIKCIF